jgi:K(+)-stimulated pyrophosphate-energized sodium pump
MIFSIIFVLTSGLTRTWTSCRSCTRPSSSAGQRRRGDLLVHGASMQTVSTGAYRAVEFIKDNIKLDSGATKRRSEQQESSRSANARKGCSTSS